MSIWYNVKGYAEGGDAIFNGREVIDGGFKQICDIQSYAKDDFDFKVLLLNTPIWYRKSKKVNKEIIQNAPSILLELVKQRVCDKGEDVGLLAGVLDLRESLKLNSKSVEYKAF